MDEIQQFRGDVVPSQDPPNSRRVRGRGGARFRHSGVARASASRPSHLTPRPRPTRPRHDARANPRTLETLAARRREISPRAPASAARAISASSARSLPPWTSAGWGRRHRARLRSATPSRRYVRRSPPRPPPAEPARGERTPRHRARAVRRQQKKTPESSTRPLEKNLGSDPPHPSRARSRDRRTTASPRPRTTGSSTASSISAPRRSPTTS